MKRNKILAVLAATLLTVACGRNATISAPTAPGGIGGGWEGRIPWSPYLDIHNAAGALPGYQQAVTELMAHGALRGARVGLSEPEVMSQVPNAVNQWLSSQGLELLVIVDDYLLFHDNLEEIMDRVVSLSPGVTTIQIGNEVTPAMSIEQYMKVFRHIYYYVSVRYPDITLVAQSTFGSGKYGSVELEKMIALGLKDMSPQRVIIGMNVYDEPTLLANADVLNSQLREYRVWVTETGSSNPEEQVGHVINFYPELNNILRSERIYWYALWGGDSGSDTGLSLIKSPETPPIWESPLYKVLTGKK